MGQVLIYTPELYSIMDAWPLEFAIHAVGINGIKDTPLYVGPFDQNLSLDDLQKLHVDRLWYLAEAAIRAGKLSVTTALSLGRGGTHLHKVKYTATGGTGEVKLHDQGSYSLISVFDDPNDKPITTPKFARDCVPEGHEKFVGREAWCDFIKEKGYALPLDLRPPIQAVVSSIPPVYIASELWRLEEMGSAIPDNAEAVITKSGDPNVHVGRFEFASDGRIQVLLRDGTVFDSDYESSTRELQCIEIESIHGTYIVPMIRFSELEKSIPELKGAKIDDPQQFRELKSYFEQVLLLCADHHDRRLKWTNLPQWTARKERTIKALIKSAEQMHASRSIELRAYEGLQFIGQLDGLRVIRATDCAPWLSENRKRALDNLFEGLSAPITNENKRGPKPKKDPTADKKLVTRWKASGLTADDFALKNRTEDNQLTGYDVRAAQNRLRVKKYRKKNA